MPSSLKFFFTDPMEMAEPLPGLEKASRVFISGSDLKTQVPGLSGSVPYGSWRDVLSQSLDAKIWLAYQEGAGLKHIDSFPTEQDFGDGRDRVFLAGDEESLELSEELDILLPSDRKQMEPELISCLGRSSCLIFPIQATNGFDLEVFSVVGMKQRIIESLQMIETPDTRRFLLNANETRSEQKFHFDLWALGSAPLPKWVEEV